MIQAECSLVKHLGELDEGKPHVQFDVEGAGEILSFTLPEKQKLEKEKNKLKSQIGDLEDRADALNTDIQNLELAKANTSEAQHALQTVKDSVERDKIFAVIVTLIKSPEALKSQPDVLEAMIAILRGFDSYLEKTDLFKWTNRPKLKLTLDELFKHLVEELR